MPDAGGFVCAGRRWDEYGKIIRNITTCTSGSRRIASCGTDLMRTSEGLRPHSRKSWDRPTGPERAAAAAEKAKLSCGAFLGNGTSQSIPLGFRPSAVLLPGRSGLLLASLRDGGAGAVEIIQQGFRVVHEDGAIDRINGVWKDLSISGVSGGPDTIKIQANGPGSFF